MAMCTVDRSAITCVGTSTICLYVKLSPLYPSLYPYIKLSQALHRFSVLQATESWAGPGNGTTHMHAQANLTQLQVDIVLSTLATPGSLVPMPRHTPRSLVLSPGSYISVASAQA